MTTIYLIRHAEADGNLYRRAHGWYDSVITDRGYRQIAALAKRFASTRFDAVYSSDRRRTMTTALSVYKTHGLPLVTTPRVREIGIGVWEDHPWAELERTDGEQLERFNTDAAHWHVAGGEHLPDVRERMIGALREIAEAHPNGTAAVFSHGMAIRLTVGTLQGLSLHEIDGTGHAENTAVSCLEYEDGAFRVAYRDDASHLENGLQTLKRQAWLKNARGFEGGIYYVPSGAEGHFDVCRAGETVGAVSVDKCENGLATIGLASGSSSSGRRFPTPARTAASGFRPDASPRATRSACAARGNGALRRPARGRTGSNFRRILNTMRNPAGKNCRK